MQRPAFKLSKQLATLLAILSGINGPFWIVMALTRGAIPPPSLPIGVDATVAEQPSVPVAIGQPAVYAQVKLATRHKRHKGSHYDTNLCHSQLLGKPAV